MAFCVSNLDGWDAALIEWGKAVAAAKDAAVKQFGLQYHYLADIPNPPAGYFDNDKDNYFLHKAIQTAWRMFGNSS